MEISNSYNGCGPRNIALFRQICKVVRHGAEFCWSGALWPLVWRPPCLIRIDIWRLGYNQREFPVRVRKSSLTTATIMGLISGKCCLHPVTWLRRVSPCVLALPDCSVRCSAPIHGTTDSVSLVGKPCRSPNALRLRTQRVEIPAGTAPKSLEIGCRS